MLTARVGIVGGGLGGLVAASLLERQGVDDYVLLEARDHFGGRVRSEPSVVRTVANHFDLGATWFWPELQPQLARLIDELGLETFAQTEVGDMLVERSRYSAPDRVPGCLSSPPSMRIAGGMGALVDAVRTGLAQERLLLGQRVCQLSCAQHYVEIKSEDASGKAASYRVGQILLAVPPRLAATRIEYLPALPAQLTRDWMGTGTWMAPHAKYIAVYDAPFWRAQGLSGEARSTVGPLVEIHDASPLHGGAALFGFFGIPAKNRQQFSEEVLRSHCLAQLARLFGAAAHDPRAELIKDWASDPYTATTADLHAPSHHAVAPSSAAATGAWQNRIIGIASEWSPHFPGYVAGAIDAASRGVAALGLTDLAVNQNDSQRWR